MRERGLIGELSLNRSLRAQMRLEAQNKLPDETGGVLLGEWRAPYTEAIVRYVIGPGPNAVHHQESFVPDYSYQEEEIARLYSVSRRRVVYLGDWHSHPVGGAYLSPRDKETLRRIAEYADARAPYPVMAVMAYPSSWTIRAWRYPSTFASHHRFLRTFSWWREWPELRVRLDQDE